MTADRRASIDLPVGAYTTKDGETFIIMTPANLEVSTRVVGDRFVVKATATPKGASHDR